MFNQNTRPEFINRDARKVKTQFSDAFVLKDRLHPHYLPYVISNFAPPIFRKVKPPEIGKVNPPIAKNVKLGTRKCIIKGKNSLLL